MLIAAVLLVAAVIVGFILVTRAEQMLTDAPKVSRSLLPGTGDAARGKYLVKDVLVCGECHGADLGGGVVLENAALGRITAPNLTTGRGGIGAKSLHEWDLAIRHGIANGRALLLMPSEGYAHLSAQDLRDVVAYFGVLPKVDRTVLRTELRPIGAALVLRHQLHADAFVIDHDTVDKGDLGVALGRGAYLLEVAGCRSCHGPELRGREVAPGKPPAADISREKLATWSFEEFVRAVRNGQGRDGHTLDPLMPSKAYAAMPDDELLALFQTLHGP